MRKILYFFTQNKRVILKILFLIILSLPAVFALFHSGFFQSDDGEWMIIRFSAFHQAFRDGQFPVRFLSRLNYGYGYPVANFLYPGFMYLSEIFHVLRFGFTDSIKAISLFSMCFSLVFTFFWLSTIFEETAAIVGAIFYLYFPYHLFDLYKRGSVGEVLALLFVPFILWMIEKKNPFFICLGIFFLIISHNTLAGLMIPVLLIYALLRKKLSVKNTILSFILGILMSSFFIIPAFSELAYTKFSSTQISNIENYFAPLPLIGSISFIIIFSTLILFLFVKYKIIKQIIPSSLVILFLFLSAFSIFFASEVSMLLWKFIPSSFIQFPFRLLSYAVVSISFLASYLVSFFKNQRKLIIACLFIFVLLLNSSRYLRPTKYFNKGENFYSTNEGTTTVQNEYMPIWVNNLPSKHFNNKVELLNGSGQINNIIYNSNKITFSTIGKDQLKTRINTIYYPGWQVTIDGKLINIDYINNLGVMDVTIPSGSHNIKLVFTETPLRLMSDFISVMSFVILLFATRCKKYNLSKE